MQNLQLHEDGKMKVFKNFFYKNCSRIALELLNICINYNMFFGIIGVINRQVHLIESVFLVYPATKKYALSYVYPEPNGEILEKLRKKNCICYHVVGVNAGALPPFPSAYKGAIPCCAAWPSPDIEVVVKKIN